MSPRSERTQRFLVVAAAGVPAALYLLYVWHYSFNLPFGDDWTKAPLIVDALRGHLDLGAMWDQHTEARLLIPNLVFVGVGRVDDFNIKVMVLLGALSFAASFFLILRLARDYVARPLTWLPVLVLGVVWFSLVDTGNSLWAFQFAWYLVIFFLALMLSFLLAWPFRRAVGVGLAALAAVCGSLSMVQGFALWPVGALCLWWTWKRTRADAVALLTWLGVMLVTAGAYFFHYEMGRGCTTGAHCSLTTPLHHPVHSGKFFVALVGYVVPKVGPFGREYAGLHQVIGLALCIAAGVVVVYSLRERKWVTRPPLALSLVVFAVLFDAALTVTRGGGRVVAASQSRFTMPNVVLVAAIVLFAWAHVPKHLAAGTGWRRRVRIGALAGLGVFVLAMAIFTTSSGLEEGRSWHRIQVTEARALANRGRIPRRTFPCYARIFVTNGSRGSVASLRPVYQWIAVARKHELYVFRRGQLAKYRALGPPKVHNVCLLPSATQLVPQPRKS